MKPAISLLFILVLSLAAFAQKNKPCSANLLKADIRGFTLGMSKDEIVKVFPSAKWEPQPNGTEVLQRFAFDDKERFGGVKSVRFAVFENTLYNILISYADTDPPANVMTFARDISKSWNIAEKWNTVGMVAIIECKQRLALVTALKTLDLSDALAQNKITKKEETERKKFKP